MATYRIYQSTDDTAFYRVTIREAVLTTIAGREYLDNTSYPGEYSTISIFSRRESKPVGTHYFISDKKTAFLFKLIYGG